MVYVYNEDLPAFALYHALAAGICAMDIETSGLDRLNDDIGCVTVHIPDSGTYCVTNIVDKPAILSQILEVQAIRKVFHYACFDLVFMVRDWNISPQNIACTKIAVHMVDPDKTQFYDPAKQKASHSLAALVYTKFGVTLNKGLAVSDWFHDLSEDQLQYVENDVIYLIDLLDQLTIRLAALRKRHDLEAAFKFIPTRVRLELDGIKDVFGYV
jgi:ribonuclease D